MNINFTELINKEELVDFKMLINQTNDKGIIKNEYKNYKINAFVNLANYSHTSTPIQQLNDEESYEAEIRTPVKSKCLDDDSTPEIEIKKGDLIFYKDRFLRIDYCKKIIEKTKEYYYCTLINIKPPTPYTHLEEDLYLSFFDFFNKLNVEAIRHDRFYENRYYEDKETPYILYFFKEIENLNEYKSTTEQLETTNNRVEYMNRTYRKYNLLIRLYDREKVMNLDLVLSKRRIFNLYYDLSNCKELKQLRILNLNFLSNEFVIQNEKVLNEKTYSLEILTETHFVYDIENMNKINVKGEIKHE